MNVWRLQRAAAFCIGVVLMLTPLLAFGSIVANWELAEPWWTVLAVIALEAAGLWLVVTATERHRRYLRPAVASAYAVEIGLLLLWFVARTGRLADAEAISPVWITTSAPVVCIGVAVAVHYRASIACATALFAVMWAVLSFAHAGRLLLAESFRALVSGALIGLFLAIVAAAMRVTRQVDDDRERVLAGAAAGAARAARETERTRVDAVVRDEVIAVLRTVRSGRPAGVQRDQARRALGVLHGVDRPERPEVVDAPTAHLRVREAVVAHGDHIAVALDVVDDGHYPAEVIEVIIDVVGEGLGNSLRHAGPEASQAVVGVFAADGIRLRVVDDGVGFVPDRVPADRMGIEIGIRARMASVPGGEAWVQSAPREGAMVSIRWERP
ncbi:sensor histidine kinase [Gordonia sp. (in: high G+C Gram-positive bacteria)]|uniref:sensor histidine kinase n=1 Tax=Gordonia sp. (in: high G+C Gram-positive bacteria) TaxID=84139 RepID=UPI003528397A